MRMCLLTLWLTTVLAGCKVGNPTPTHEYLDFVSRSGASYASDCNGGEVCIWFRPQRSGYEIQGLSIKNVQVPEGSIVDVSRPSTAKGEQSMILTVRNVNLAESVWRIAWDVYQGNVRRQTIHVDVTPPPDVKASVDGYEVPTRRLPNTY